jgi:hypothetical protein
MSGKRIGLSIFIVAVCGLSGLRAQGPAPAPDVLPLYTPFGSDAASPYDPTTTRNAGSGIPSFVSAPAGVTAEGVALDEGNPPPPPPVPIPLGLPASPYLTYPRSPCCCGAVGTCGGPIGSALFFRSGFAFPVGTSIFDRYLHTGWDVEGGGQLFLFNQHSTAAWTGTLGISNMFLRTGNANLPVTLYRVPVHTAPTTPSPFPSTQIAVIPSLDVTVSSLNMTFVNVGFGREWWLLGSANPGQQQGWNWRVGIDGGGRWGSAKVEFDQIQHHTGVVGGMYLGLDSDIEHPFRCGIVFAGTRLEYNYIWTHLLQDQNNGDFQSLNLLFQLGIRF